MKKQWRAVTQQKVTQLVSLGKLNVQLAEEKEQVNVALREVGAMMYATHTGAPTNSEQLLEKLTQLDGYYENIRQLEAKIAALKTKAVCTKCGAMYAQQVEFCAECGAKL